MVKHKSTSPIHILMFRSTDVFKVQYVPFVSMSSIEASQTQQHRYQSPVALDCQFPSIQKSNLQLISETKTSLKHRTLVINIKRSDSNQVHAILLQDIKSFAILQLSQNFQSAQLLGKALPMAVRIILFVKSTLVFWHSRSVLSCIVGPHRLLHSNFLSPLSYISSDALSTLAFHDMKML